MTRIKQIHRNTAKELFRVSDELNTFGRSLVQPDQPQLTSGDLLELEDNIFSALLLIRAARHAISANPLHEKGQRA